MKSLLKLLAAGSIALCPSLQSAVVINSSEFAYAQDFSSLPSTGTTLTWTNNATIPGWYRWYTGTESTLPPFRDASVQAAGTSNSGVASEDGFLNVGQNGSTNRALVTRRAFNEQGAFGMVFQNNSGGALTSFSVGYTGEQWRRHGTEATGLYFEYAIVPSHDAGTFNILSDYSWTRVAALTFVSPAVGTATGINGDLAANRQVIAPVTITTSVPDGHYLAIRWFQDRTNLLGAASDSRHALGVDSMTLTAIPEPATYALSFALFATLVVWFRRRRS